MNLIDKDRDLITKIGSTLFLCKNRSRFIARSLGSAVSGVLTALVVPVSYAILFTIIYFTETADCGYGCEDYFETISGDIFTVYAVDSYSSGHIVITTDRKVN